MFVFKYLFYANETDGKEIASIFAHEDAEVVSNNAL